MAGLQTGQVNVGTSATLVCNAGALPDGVLISSTAACFVGGPGVTTTTGIPIPANTPVKIPTTGADALSIYAVVASASATVSYAFPG